MPITIDGKAFPFEPGQTIYEVARDNGIYIPVLCHHDQLKPVGACRVCVVEVEKARTLVASCTMPAEEGMVVSTDTERVRQSRRLTVELLITQGHHNCITCEASGNCILQNLAYTMGIEIPRFSEPEEVKETEQANEMIIRDMNKCVLCGICVRACKEIQVNNAMGVLGKGVAFFHQFEAEFVQCQQGLHIIATHLAGDIAGAAQLAFKGYVNDTISDIAPAVHE